MTEPERLGIIEAIKQLKARYLRLADTKDWEGLARCFCADVVCDWRGATTDPGTGRNLLPGSDAVISGREAVMQTIVASLGEVRSVHQCFMPEIEVTGEDTACGIWAMADRLYIPAGTGITILQGYGHYHNTFRRVKGDWMIQTLRLIRLRVEIEQ
ncbi:MAG TPA: nuclear transport factor 2 family protein [Steroidobacteraceae bacterium]|nr:nuclear transport factor 2 family protein [Steroidobacteraceae bacterium]